MFAPEISLVNIDELRGTNSTVYVNDITSLENLESRAQAFGSSGAAANVGGAKAVFSISISLATTLSPDPTVLAADFWPLIPLSRGHGHINSSDPLDNPIITPRFLTDTFDQSVAVAIARRSQKLFQSPVLAHLIADPYYNPTTGPNGSDAEYLAWYDAGVGTGHWIGISCTAGVQKTLHHTHQ